MAACAFGATQVCMNTFLVTWMVAVRDVPLTTAGALAATGIEVVARVPVHIAPNHHNRGYLLTKVSRMGHLAAPDAKGFACRGIGPWMRPHGSASSHSQAGARLLPASAEAWRRQAA